MGLPGNDVLRGGLGADRLGPGTGSDSLFDEHRSDTAIIIELDYATPDTFVGDDLFSRPAETDTVTDFKRSQGDRIDVYGIDADPSTFGADPLRFSGTAGFDGSLGESRCADTFIQVVRNSDIVAEFEIRLTGAFELRENDFIFAASAATGFGATAGGSRRISLELILA